MLKQNLQYYKKALLCIVFFKCKMRLKQEFLLLLLFPFVMFISIFKKNCKICKKGV